jgi:hypothetical protein
LDHHRINDQTTCAAHKCWLFITQKRRGAALDLLTDGAVTQLVEVVRQIDNAQDLNWAEKSEPRETFYLHQLIGGLKGHAENDHQVIEFGFRALDAILLSLKNIFHAKEELATKAVFFTSPWGQAAAAETGNEQFLWEAEKQGFLLAIRKNLKDGSVRMAARPDSSVDLAPVMAALQRADPASGWYLHPSGKLLLNQSSLNPNLYPTTLSLGQIISIIRKIQRSNTQKPK